MALAQQWDTVWENVELSWFRIGVGLALVVVAVLALGRGWSALIPSAQQATAVRRSFYLAMPAKYIPGGFAHPIGQVALATGKGVAAGESVAAFVIHAFAIVAAGAWLGSGVALNSLAPAWLRILAACGTLAILLLWRPFLLGAARIAMRMRRRTFDEAVLAPQRAIVVAFAWTAVGIGLGAVAFATIAGTSLGTGAFHVATAFSLAFVVGYVAVPFPAGVGIREAILALALPTAGLPTVIAVSAMHRVVTMTSELAVVAATRRRRDAAGPG